MTHDLAASGLRFGIEEEFFLLDASDLDIVRSAPAGFVAACRDTLGEHFAEEMFECQVEVASPVFSTLAEAARFHGQARQRLAHLAMEFGLRSLCVGTHPFADWRRARSNPAAHFARLFKDQGRVARRSLVCGLHVHVEIPPSHDRMAVLQRVLPWLPLLLALSASSPFRGGRRSGLASYRRALCGEWPRMNIPPALPDENAYRRHLALLREAGCIREDGQVWWMIRTVFPCADPGAAYLRRLPAPGRRAEPGRAVQGAGGRSARRGPACVAGRARRLPGGKLLAGAALRLRRPLSRRRTAA